ncbi:SUMF1/EgtB/PvdOfamily nonheme iron enzyme [Histomonas meleagridis]|uniref:SUMF1/EgtB/PvdOfamily nonheme iron enzyme n=1 Tax=Histomonas meleagridis TaxID=135588 RepID=UPI00355A47C6|nr:SUMF1/EgtB/PvdOfamily nonheme iron enzyme [Histomonas meleagridis]KAH0802617.1 SUMF1/EgtB/PvdOfamily nonheme iron enzyme [Histomonas meleagridis]
MSSIEKLYLPSFNEMNNEEKVQLLASILPKDYKVEYTNDHIQVIYNEKVFIFVPGCKGVTLGWSSEDKVPDDLLNQEKEFIEMIRKEMDETGYEGEKPEFSAQKFIEEFNGHMSPIRTVDIGPMLVEPIIHPTSIEVAKVDRQTNEIISQKEGFDPFDFYKPNPNFPQYDGLETQVFSQKGNILYRCIDGIIYFYTFYSPNTLKANLKPPYRLMTEDEWEYFYTGTKREFEPEVPDYIYIAKNPYEYEIVESPCGAKGGDGGCCVCGCEGPAKLRLVLCPFFRNCDECRPEANDKASSYNNYRLMIRVEEII